MSDRATQVQLENSFDNVINPATEDKQDDIITALGLLGSPAYSIRIAESGNYTYVGKASIASAEGDAVWQIQRLDGSTGLAVLWADGDSDFDNIWSNYLTLSYS